MSRSQLQPSSESIFKKPELDFLSHCASFFDILLFIDHKTILNCKLVSRLFYDVIRRNTILIPRLSRSMQFTVHTEIDGVQHICILVGGYWIITDEHIYLYGQVSKNKFLDRFEMMGGVECSTSRDQNGRMQSLMSEFGVPFCCNRMWFELAIGSIEGGVRKVMAPFTETYHWKDLCIAKSGRTTNSDMEKWIEVVGDVCYQNYAKVDLMEVDHPYTGIEKLIQPTGSTRVLVGGVSNLDDVLLSNLNTLERNELYIKMDREHEIQSLQIIIYIIKKWQSGDIGRVKQLQLSGSCLGQPRIFRWTNEEFVDCLKDNKILPSLMNYENTPPKWKNVEVFIRRHQDIRLLCISYSRDFCELVIYDVAYGVSGTSPSGVSFDRSRVFFHHDQGFRENKRNRNARLIHADFVN